MAALEQGRPATTVSGWIRTNRRAPGSPWRADDDRPQVFHAGPWHAIRGRDDRPGIQSGARPLSWCGRQPTGVTINVRRHPGAEPPAGERLCAECVRRVAEGRPRAYRGRGRRQA